MFDFIKFRKIHLVATIFISIIILQNLLFDRNKLHEIFSHTALNKLFDHDISRKNVNDYRIQEIITILDADSQYDGPKQHDFFLKNQSIQLCYFSIFGYDLEKLKPIVTKLIFDNQQQTVVDENLITSKEIGTKINIYTGNPLFEKNDTLNFVNPSCYLNPKDNNCDKNFLFKSDKKKDLINFLNYRPFEFKQSKIQIFFNYLSIVIFLLNIVYFIYFITLKILTKKNPSRI